jgi:hypothetical protein
MKIRRAARIGVVVVAVACLTLSGARTARAQVKLQYKFPEGKTLRYRTNWNAFQTVTLMGGMEIQSRENKTVVQAQSIGKRRGDSTLPVEMKVESLHVELRVQGGIDLKFDSKKPDAKIDDPDLALLVDVYRVESTVAYTVVLDKQDQVKAVEGTEKLREKAGKLDAITRELIRGRIEADRLKTQFQQEHRNLPDAPAKPGESWERTEVIDYGGQALSFRKKYDYGGTEKRGGKTLDKITSKVLEVKCLPPDSNSASPLKVTKSDLKVESSEGMIFFDREAGYVVEARERTKIKGTMTSSGAGTDTSSPIDLTLQTNTQLQAAAK